MGRVSPPRRRGALRGDLTGDGSQHRDHHPDRLVAEARRGWLSGSPGSIGGRSMTPSHVATNLPTEPVTYSWEATDEEVAARYGVPIDRILRFDLNTSPAPPELAARVLAEGAFETPLSESPPADYRRLVEAAARVYGVDPAEVLVGAGADEILDLLGKVFIPPGGSAVIPTPTYAM